MPLNNGSASFTPSGGSDTTAVYALFFLLESLTKHPQMLGGRTVDSA